VIEKVRDVVQVDESRSQGNQIPLGWAVKVISHLFELVEVLMDK